VYQVGYLIEINARCTVNKTSDFVKLASKNTSLYVQVVVCIECRAVGDSFKSPHLSEDVEDSLIGIN
jgi:hypothetical protein